MFQLNNMIRGVFGARRLIIVYKKYHICNHIFCFELYNFVQSML